MLNKIHKSNFIIGKSKISSNESINKSSSWIFDKIFSDTIEKHLKNKKNKDEVYLLGSLPMSFEVCR